MAHLQKPETLPLRRQLLQRLSELDLGVLQTLTSTGTFYVAPSRKEACASVVTPEPDAPTAPAASAAGEQPGDPRTRAQVVSAREYVT